jgi:hypothetical protein
VGCRRRHLAAAFSPGRGRSFLRRRSRFFRLRRQIRADSALDDEIIVSTDHHEVFDIVAAHEYDSAVAVDRGGIDNGEARLAAAAAMDEHAAGYPAGPEPEYPDQQQDADRARAIGDVQGVLFTEGLDQPGIHRTVLHDAAFMPHVSREGVSNDRKE